MHVEPDPAEPAREDRANRFRALARPLLPRLYAVARNMVGPDAEDAVQDCLLKAFQRFDQLQDPAAGRAWLTTILINCCRDRARARARRPDEVDIDAIEEFSLYRKIAYEDPFPYSDSLHLDFLDGFGPADVTAVLLRLPPMYRIPLVLVYMEGGGGSGRLPGPGGRPDAGPPAGHRAVPAAPGAQAVRGRPEGLRRGHRPAREGTAMISCADAVNELWAYLDDVLGERDWTLVEEHLGLCQRCCGELEFARELRRFLARTCDEDIPGDVLRRLNDTLEDLDP